MRRKQRPQSEARDQGERLWHAARQAATHPDDGMWTESLEWHVERVAAEYPGVYEALDKAFLAERARRLLRR